MSRVGDHQHNAFHIAGQEQGHCLGFTFQVVVGKEGQDGIAAAGCGIGDALQALGKDGVEQGRQDHADDSAALAAQTACRGIGLISQCVDRGLHAQAGFLTHLFRLIEHARDRRNRYLCCSGDIQYSYVGHDTQPSK